MQEVVEVPMDATEMKAPLEAVDVDLEATPMARIAEMSGRVEGASNGVSLVIPTQTGAVVLPNLLLFTGQPKTGASSIGSVHGNDPLTEEYRALFAEYVDLRRTCGEAADDLDRDRFIEALRQERSHLIQKLAVKDVRFRLAFDNGKAAIRFKTIA